MKARLTDAELKKLQGKMMQGGPLAAARLAKLLIRRHRLDEKEYQCNIQTGEIQERKA